MSEKPAECQQCHKKIDILYEETSEKGSSCLGMCSDCPFLEKKLEKYLNSKEKDKGELKCANCFTTLEAIKEGNPVGCTHCHVAFGAALIDFLLPEETPINKETSNPTFSLGSLNEALHRALTKENYELAASLRDQIKELLK